MSDPTDDEITELPPFIELAVTKITEVMNELTVAASPGEIADRVLARMGFEVGERPVLRPYVETLLRVINSNGEEP
jgi:hypothetical protein